MDLEKTKMALESLCRELAGCRFIVLINTKNLKLVLELWEGGVENRNEIKDNLIHILKYIVLDRQEHARNPFIRKALQDFKSLTFEMERGYALFTVTPFENYIVASGFSKRTNLGFWKAVLSRVMEELKDVGNKG